MKINWLTIVKDWFGLLAIVIAAMGTIGLSVSTPWPARADVESIQQTVKEQQAQIKQQQCLILRVLLRGYQDDLDRAEDELSHNPASSSAKRDKIDAETQIASIMTQLRQSNCF